MIPKEADLTALLQHALIDAQAVPEAKRDLESSIALYHKGTIGQAIIEWSAAGVVTGITTPIAILGYAAPAIIGAAAAFGLMVQASRHFIQGKRHSEERTAFKKRLEEYAPAAWAEAFEYLGANYAKQGVAP